MSQAADQPHVSVLGSRLLLAGEINFYTAREIFLQMEKQLSDAVDCIDCSGVTHADSTLLSLLLHAWSEAQRRQQPLRFCGLSSTTLSLAGLYGVDFIVTNASTAK